MSYTSKFILPLSLSLITFSSSCLQAAAWTQKENQNELIVNLYDKKVSSEYNGASKLNNKSGYINSGLGVFDEYGLKEDLTLGFSTEYALWLRYQLITFINSTVSIQGAYKDVDTDSVYKSLGLSDRTQKPEISLHLGSNWPLGFFTNAELSYSHTPSLHTHFIKLGALAGFGFNIWNRPSFLILNLTDIQSTASYQGQSFRHAVAALDFIHQLNHFSDSSWSVILGAQTSLSGTNVEKMQLLTLGLRFNDLAFF